MSSIAAFRPDLAMAAFRPWLLAQAGLRRDGMGSRRGGGDARAALGLLGLAGLLGAIAFAGPAAAAGAEGVWMRSDGLAKVQFSPCGGGMCGTIVWLRRPDGPAHVGEQVFFGMRQTSPTSWEGSAHNPEDGRDYDGSMVLAGNHLTTKGCALGGMICKSQSWSRSR
jgi:uncharacterized protein (DUF2147 family)